MRQALAIDPERESAYYNLAVLLLLQQNPEEAEQCLDRAIKLRPADAINYNELGNALEMQGKTGSAIAAYRKAIELQPRFRDAYFRLGELFRGQNDLHSALGCFRSAYDCDHGFVRAKAMEALVLERLGDIDTAYQCLEPWLKRKTVEPVLADVFAAVSIHLNKEREAIDYLKRTIEAQPSDDLWHFFWLGKLQERLQQYDSAFQSYTKANELAPIADNAENFILNLRQARRIFPKSAMSSAPRAASGGGALIFIVGMPRSGTSLVEQILSTHSQVLAGGRACADGQACRGYLFGGCKDGWRHYSPEPAFSRALCTPAPGHNAGKYWLG